MRAGIRQTTSSAVDWADSHAFRIHCQDAGKYSWWDYRMLSFPKNRGLRIDLALVTQPLFSRVKEVSVDRAPRELQRPSDHAPVVVEIE